MKWGVPDQKDVEKAYHRGFEESTDNGMGMCCETKTMTG